MTQLLNRAKSQLNNQLETSTGGGQFNSGQQVYNARGTAGYNQITNELNKPSTSHQKPSPPIKKTFGHSMSNMRNGAENRSQHVWGSSAMSDHLALPIDGGENYYADHHYTGSQFMMRQDSSHQPGDNLLDNFSSSVVDGEEDSGNEDDYAFIRKVAEKNHQQKAKQMAAAGGSS